MLRGATEKVSLIKSQEISLFIKKIREMKGLKGEVANISRTHTNKVLRIINRLTSLPEDDKKPETIVNAHVAGCRGKPKSKLD